MNLIEKLQQKIRKKMPQVNSQLDRPYRPDGLWCLDLRVDHRLVVVEWSPERGFGVSSGEGGYGERPDEVFAKVSDAEARVLDLLSNGTETRPPHAVLVQRLRELRGLTQIQLAERMGIRQGTLSRLERGDMHISTLKRLVASMGGTLQIQAVFADSIIPLEEAALPQARPARKVQKRTQA